MSQSITETLALYKDKRLLPIFFLGFCSGFPWVLIGSSMSAWLQESGLSRSSIGFFGSMFVIYALNFLWAPLVDRFKLPLFCTFLGLRRGWIAMMLLIIVMSSAVIGFITPGDNLFFITILAILIVVPSATQDITIDAYRIESFDISETDKIATAAAVTTCGWWTGFAIPGAFAFYLSDIDGISWGHIYQLLAAFTFLLLLIVVFLIKEPSHRTIPSIQNSIHGTSDWIKTTFFDPFSEFFRRNGFNIALSLLALIFLFKIGEAFLGRMSIVFYKEIGFTNSEIAYNSKLIGWWVIIIFTILGQFINVRFGIIKGLLIGGIAMAGSNLIFAYLASVGPNTTIFKFAIIVDNFTTAISTVTFVTFISYLTSRAYTATQYALFASVGNFSRTTLASFSGVTVDYLGGNWEQFFILTTFMVIPSLILLMWLKYKNIPAFRQIDNQ